MASRHIQLATVVATAAAVLAAALSVGASSVVAGNPCFHGYEIPSATDSSATRVQLAQCDFAPTVARVAAGATVTFVNDSDVAHLITGANQEWGSRDVQLQPGSTVAYRFDRPGVYPYACALHEGMTGAIVVGEGPSGATADDRGADEPDDPAMAGVVTAGAGALGLFLGAAGLWFATRRRRE